MHESPPESDDVENAPKPKVASALAHEDGRLELVTQGRDELADEIIRTAKLYDIPVVENLYLSKQLEHMDVGDHIPEQVFFALAKLMEYIYGLDNQEKTPDK